MPHPRNFDLHAIDDVARGQGGIVTFRQLCELGMSQGSISRWTRTGGRWQRLLPGVYLVHRGTPTAEERLQAAHIYAGQLSQFTGSAALRLHGLRNVPGVPERAPLHLLIPNSQQTQSAGFVTLERTRRLPDPVVLSGLRVAPLARAIFDAGRRSTSRQATRAFTLEAIQRGLTTVDQLRSEIRHGQRQWTAVFREVTAEAEAGVRSVPEADLRAILSTAGVPEPLWNPRLETPGGIFIAEPDGYYDELGLALEVDSRRHHYEDADDYAHTWRRHERYAQHGIAVLRLMPRDIRTAATNVVASVVKTMETQRGKPTPNVRVIPQPRAK